MRVEIDCNDNLDCYVTINGQDIPCSREVYLTIKRPGRKDAMRNYRNQRPFINGSRCQEDCTKCPHFVKGLGCTNTGDVSFEVLSEDGFEASASDNVEDEATAAVMLEMMQKELEDEDGRLQEIFSLMVKEVPQREIASQLNIADGTVTYYIKKIRAKLEKFR